MKRRLYKTAGVKPLSKGFLITFVWCFDRILLNRLCIFKSNLNCLKHEINVFSENKIDCLILAVNKKYHESIVAKLKSLNLNI